MLKLTVITFCFFIIFHPNASAKPGKLKNFCTNGGFERLNPQGLPFGWNGFAGKGASFGISKEAKNGDNALMMKSTSDAVVGINRTQDALIPLIRGVARFWYKSVSSGVDGKNLQVCIIAMNESGEKEVGRQIYTVFPEHLGDGEWHFAEFEFDFSQRKDVKQIHFAPRINETSSEKAAGELLIDDVEVTMVGAKLEIERFGAAEPLLSVGDTGNIRLVVKNVGDQDALDIEGKLFLPDGVTTDTRNLAAFRIEKIEPDRSITLNWKISCEKPASGTMEVAVNSSLFSASYLTVANLAEPELQLANDNLCVKFFKTAHGYGIFSIEQGDAGGTVRLAQSSMFSSLVYRTHNNAIKHVPLFADEVERQHGKYIFKKQFTDIDGVRWSFEFIFELQPEGKWVNVTYKATAKEKREVLAFYGPVLYASRNNRYGAIFPGLEYLEGDESSSSTLDIAPPNNIRRVPHPNKITIPLMAVSENQEESTVITGMMWDAKQKWATDFDRPAALFASPNRFECMEDYDVMGLFVPSVPNWVEENETKAKVAYNLELGVPLEIEAQLFSIRKTKPNLSAIHAVTYWIEKYGLPEPLPLPRNTSFLGGKVGRRPFLRKPRLPHPQRKRATLEKEMEFSLMAYMDTLWVPDEGTWHNTLDFDPWGTQVNPEFARQLWLAAKILPDAPKNDEYLKRAELAIEKLGNNPGKDFPFYIGGLDKIYPRFKGLISGLIQTQKDDGSWRFDPDYLNSIDKIHHQDYHKLGKEGDVEIGICAQKAYTLLRYARMTGDKVSLEAGLKALAFMRRFNIPRAAQVWEVPVHTPDVLASAHATQAYLEAYKITEEDSYLDAAIYWAYTGLPFVYLWQDDEMPYMLYASIPVFGATWFTHSWFGVAVQWNGLDYAYALFNLAEYDDSLPWRKIAEGLTVSGLYQQETSAKYLGLYPDAYNLMDKTTSAWKLSPRQIVRNLFVMMGYPAEPVTAIVRQGDKKVHLNAVVPIEKPELSDKLLAFFLNYPTGMDGYVMIAGLDKPGQDAVVKNQQIMSEVTELEAVAEGWKYDERYGLLFMKIKQGSGEISIAISEPQFKTVPQLSLDVGWESRGFSSVTRKRATPAKKIDWLFNKGGLRDWTAANDLICQFGYGKNKGLSFQMFDEDELDDIIKSLIYNNTFNRGAIFTRVCRIYKHLGGYDCVFLIKPHALHYWLNSIALRDADETFMDLKKAGRFV